MSACTFGWRTDSRSPLWRKIEAVAAAREAERQAAGAAARQTRQASMLEARRRHRARVTRRALIEHRLMARLRDASRPNRILWEVARKHDVPREAITRRVTNHFAARDARHEACWRLYAETDMSSKRISQWLGGIDHTTVLHNVGAWMRRHGETLPPHRQERQR